MDNRMSLRTVICFCLALCLFLVCSIRIILITSEPSYAEVTAQNNTLSIKIAETRGAILDCNGAVLTMGNDVNIAVASPTPQVIMFLSEVLSDSQKYAALEQLNKGKPAVIKTEKPLYCDGIINLKVNQRETENKICDHLLGYVDSSNHGVSGLEKLFDGLLYDSYGIKVRFYTDGANRVLKGIEGEVLLNESIKETSVMTTIDKDIQIIAENSAQKIDMGAVVISEVGTGKIRAMVSRPDFDSTNIAEYLNSEKSPLINRCLMSYNVGSAFKPCVAAAALESGGLSNFTNNCTGNISVENNIFNCHNRAGHELLDLKGAIANSCNTYFYNLSFKLGGEKIYNLATVFGFGYKKTLCDGLFTSSENLTALDTLNNSRSALANLSIGQGELLASPVTMLSLYEAIANNGIYYPQTIIEGVMEQGVLKSSSQKSEPTQAFSKETSEILKEALIEVIENGTGTKAKPDFVSAAGKTATAQTGQKDKNGNYIEHSWFCGFFPATNPKYVVCVVIENADSSNFSGADVFKEIADSVSETKGIIG